MTASESSALELIAPTAEAAKAEIVHAQAACALPKTTELFMSDVHGEYEAFSQVLRGACGGVRHAVKDVFGNELDAEQADALVALVCRPERVLDAQCARADEADAWLADTLTRLSSLCAAVAQGHTLDAALMALPEDLAPVVDELVARPGFPAAAATVASAVEAGLAPAAIQALCAAVQHLTAGRLHLVGDVYDRGPAPDAIMEELIAYPDVDVQWGNHDIVWMGAALGQRGCIAHVVRNCARYGNLSILTDAYGIDLAELERFARSAYADDPCVAFGLKGNPDLAPEELELNIKIQKAMAIIQFKVEARLIDENPSFGLEDRKLLHRIDHAHNTIVVDGVEYELADTVFPTVDWNDPYALTAEEEAVTAALEDAFQTNEKLQRHMAFFLEHGSLYKIENNTLMFHACVPLNADGSLKQVNLYGETLAGRALFDAVDRHVRAAFEETDPIKRKQGRDLLWYLWLGEGSPLFAKSKMATFEIYLIADKAARKEVKNPFYSLLNDPEVFAGVFKDFGMDPETSRIVCGHVPVKVKDGEDPVKCGGQVLIIDGGFSSAYQSTTGVAGFTLVSDANGVTLATHEPFAGIEAVVERNADVRSTLRVLERPDEPITVAQTDEGAALRARIASLEELFS